MLSEKIPLKPEVMLGMVAVMRTEKDDDCIAAAMPLAVACGMLEGSKREIGIVLKVLSGKIQNLSYEDFAFITGVKDEPQVYHVTQMMVNLASNRRKDLDQAKQLAELLQLADPEVVLGFLNAGLARRDQHSGVGITAKKMTHMRQVFAECVTEVMFGGRRPAIARSQDFIELICELVDHLIHISDP